MQRCIGRLASVVGSSQMGSVVDRLNARGDQRLSAMWELVILDAMSRVGKLRHEVPLANGSRPDFELATEADGGRELLVVGDITAVSDAWLDEQNPVNVLFEEVGRRGVGSALPTYAAGTRRTRWHARHHLSQGAEQDPGPGQAAPPDRPAGTHATPDRSGR